LVIVSEIIPGFSWCLQADARILTIEPQTLPSKSFLIHCPHSSSSLTLFSLSYWHSYKINQKDTQPQAPLYWAVYGVEQNGLLTCEMWSLQGFDHVNGWMFPIILKKHITFYFKDQEIPGDTWSWRHHVLLRWEQLAQQNGIISQKSWIVRWLTTCCSYTYISFHAQWQTLIQG
jgi:hypothetical protein